MNDHKRLAGIAARNAATQVRIDAYRADAANRDVPRVELEYLIRDNPWFGLVPCRACDVDFVMLHANDDIVARDYLWIGADGYEPEIVRQWVQWCRNPGLVLDIGGYSGLMSLIAANAHHANEVHLFEPLERTMERANVNIKLNGLAQRIRMHTVAASDADGTAEISLHYAAEFLSTGNAINPKHDRAVADVKTIRTVALDSLMPDARPQTVKIDVEGHELAVLQGMEQMLRRSLPRMIIEIWAATRPEVMAFLHALGYVLTRFEAFDLGVNNYAAVVPALEPVAELEQ